ncbi:MAG: IIA-like nitrogen-regulatory protein PtsN [Myxococcaceae bacterium]|nr:IIA-like nitrogen-regulatory protein PtsN [Myxococcaceae bacterium]
MRLMDILSEQRVTTELTATTKEEALSALATLFTRDDSTLDALAVYEVLSERERLASTGIGSGVAIPHGRIAHLERLQAAVAISPLGIPFDAIDGAPVRIVVGVLAPQHHTGDHLRVLARVSRLLRSPEVRESLLSATSSREAFEVIARSDAG